MTDSESAVTQPLTDSGGGVREPAHPSIDVDLDDDLDVISASLGTAPPRRGDTLTLYSLDQAAPWLGVGVDTLRRMIRQDLIPRHFLSRPSPGKTMLCGDAIHALADWFREVDWDARLAGPPPGARPHRSRGV